MSNRLRTALAPLWLAALAVAAAAGGRADEPQAAPRDAAVHGLTLTAAGSQILVSFRLENAFGPDLVRRLESGLPTGFTYEIELMRDRKRWYDERLDHARLDVVAMYNAVTSEFLVNLKQDGKLIESRTLRDRGELQTAMTVFSAMPIFTLEDPSPRERYLVRARVELAAGSVLGFIPVRRTTSWVESGNKLRIRH